MDAMNGTADDGQPVLYHGSRLGAHGLWSLDPATAPERRDVRLVRRSPGNGPSRLKRVRSGSYTLLEPLTLNLASVTPAPGFGIGAELLRGGVANDDPEVVYVFDDRRAGVHGVLRARPHRGTDAGVAPITVLFGEARSASDVLRAVRVEWYPVAGPVLAVAGADPVEHPSAAGARLWTELTYTGVQPMVLIQAQRVAAAVAEHFRTRTSR